MPLACSKFWSSPLQLWSLPYSPEGGYFLVITAIKIGSTRVFNHTVSCLCDLLEKCKTASRTFLCTFFFYCWMFGPLKLSPFDDPPLDFFMNCCSLVVDLLFDTMLSALFVLFSVRPLGGSFACFPCFVFIVNEGPPTTLQNTRVGKYFQSVLPEYP